MKTTALSILAGLAIAYAAIVVAEYRSKQQRAAAAAGGAS